jgi:hypothetical protein
LWEGEAAPGLKPYQTDVADTGPKPRSSTGEPKGAAGAALQEGSRTAKSPDQVFRAFVEAGKRLAEIHVHYEEQPEYPLKKIEKPVESSIIA